MKKVMYSKNLTMLDNHSSKGNQLKWHDNNIWYKADYLGYEGLSEMIVSRLLEKSNINNYVQYDSLILEYNNMNFIGCCCNKISDKKI